MFLFTCNEGAYLLEETSWAIKSLARHEPNTPVRLILFDSDGRYDARIRRWHPKIEIEHFRPDEKIDPSSPGYFFSYKALIFEHALSSTDRDVIFLDGDLVVRGALHQIFDQMQNADISLRYRPSVNVIGPMGSPGAARFNSGVVALRNNARTLSYLKRVRALIAQHLEKDGASQSDGVAITGIDQEAMWIAYNELRDDLDMHPLSDAFNDSYFLPTSYIWHAKGNARRHQMYKVAKDEIRFGRFARWYHRDAIENRKTFTDRLSSFRGKMRADYFSLDEKETKMACDQLSNGKLVSFSSDFLLANPELVAAAKETLCHDWDPAAYYHNLPALRSYGVRHELKIHPLDVVIDDASLILTDVDVRGERPTVLLSIPDNLRFQDFSTLAKLYRERNDLPLAPAFALINFPHPEARG